jgi:hypothetical protein
MRRRSLGLSWIDFLVVAATSLTFAATVFSQQHRAPGPPSEQTIQAMAAELGITADQFHRAIVEVPPPIRGFRESGEQRTEHHRLLASLLNVPVDRLDVVMHKYGPPQRF